MSQLSNAVLSAGMQLAVLGGVPFLVYSVYQKWVRGRTFRESAKRAGLQLGEPRYIVYASVFVWRVLRLSYSGHHRSIHLSGQGQPNVNSPG